jgi:hypothetical protein
MKKFVFALVFFSTIQVFAKPILGLDAVADASYSEEGDLLTILIINNCREVTVTPSGGCARSMPGQLTLIVSQGDRITECTREAYKFHNIPADDLNCRPANIDVLDEATGLVRTVYIPAKR